MQADFLDAHERHWSDAEILFQKQCWANADHLYGFAAECGLKGLMVAFGMQQNPDKEGMPLSKHDQKHIDNLKGRYETYRAGANAANYLLAANDPFTNWRASDRYAGRSNFSEQHVVPHQQGTLEIRNLISKARKAGLVV